MIGLWSSGLLADGIFRARKTNTLIPINGMAAVWLIQIKLLEARKAHQLCRQRYLLIARDSRGAGHAPA